VRDLSNKDIEPVTIKDVPSPIKSTKKTIGSSNGRLKEYPRDVSTEEKVAFLVKGGCNDAQQHYFEKALNKGVDVFSRLGYLALSNVKLPTLTYLETMLTGDIIKRSPKRLFLYFVDHGKKDEGLLLNTEGQILTPRKLNEWLDKIEDEVVGLENIVVVIESCYSGMFIPELSGKNRVIITSTDANNVAYGYKETGLPLFSGPFFDALEAGHSYGEAWEIADEVVDKEEEGLERKGISTNNLQENREIYPQLLKEWDGRTFSGKEAQNPLIDDNGDGCGSGTSEPDDLNNLEDGNFASGLYP
jgi:hypothetical protein